MGANVNGGKTLDLGFFKLENSLFISLTVICAAKSFDGGQEREEIQKGRSL